MQPGAAALVAAVVWTLQIALPTARAAQARAYMSVTAVVVNTVRIDLAHQAQTLEVTPRDIEHGYVQVRAGSRVGVTHPGPLVLDFRPTQPLISGARVTAPGASVDLGARGGTLVYGTKQTNDLTLDYRFELAPGVQPGTYPWPLALTLLPM